MSEEDLQLLITLDNPVDVPEDDTFSHVHLNNLEYWLGRRFPAASENDPYVSFGQGDWTCTLTKLTGATNVCTVTHWRDGEVVEQKVFQQIGPR